VPAFLPYYYNNKWFAEGGSSTLPKAYDSFRVYGNGTYPCRIDETLLRGKEDDETPESTDLYFYLHDHLYSPVLLAGYTGVPVERYEYDAYGN